ncbi:cysteine hydrolase [Mechercharimyces sp. CAU 1602]|uniref:cysteine hydrolase n=1 Tax=Mechercharimyces sp. CAU 1602 TaxID=2973933 RepID=UPI0021625226|nr:cysteine hydrolase [Mechercharimyces sp. CAU 1602]MCS1350244.1 cysteine hydrolase [Mechercharimyces sp. CAU 1602]
MEKKKALIMIDVQKEYITDGRPFCIETIGPSLEKAKEALEHARDEGWTILHVRHLQEGSIFHPDSEYSQFVSGFEPLPDEHSFIKGDFSCFSSNEFKEFMESLKGHDIYIAGYGSTMCCLATIIDGYHRGFTFTFIHDASSSKRSDQFDEVTRHQHVIDHLSTFAQMVTTAEVKK